MNRSQLMTTITMLTLALTTLGYQNCSKTEFSSMDPAAGNNVKSTDQITAEEAPIVSEDETEGLPVVDSSREPDGGDESDDDDNALPPKRTCKEMHAGRVYIPEQGEIDTLKCLESDRKTKGQCIKVCHTPPGQPDNAKVMYKSIAFVSALANRNSDSSFKIGECESQN